MQIKDLQPKQGKVDLTADVIDKSSPKEFQKFGAPGKLCNIRVKDETGELMMTLWNDQVEKVNVGDKIRVSNGYVNEWQGEMQLSTGKFGKLEIIGKSSAAASKSGKQQQNVLGTKDEEPIDDKEDSKDEEDDEDEDEDSHDNIEEEEIN